MSHYRNLGGGKRDANEPEVMKRFRFHGWHPEQISGNRLWDLNVYPPKQPAQRVVGVATCVFHVDVKMPGGTVTKAQGEKWEALAAKGIPVYVVRTAEDVDALVRGELLPWRPWDEEVRGMSGGTKRGARPGQVTPRGKGMRPPENGSDRLKPCGCKRSLGRCEHSGNYTPPRSKPVDAAKEAEETFAPPPTRPCVTCGVLEATVADLLCFPCSVAS